MKVQQARRIFRARLLAVVFFIGLGLPASQAATLTIPIENKTGLDTNRYAIHVLGFSTGRVAPTHVVPVALTVQAGSGKVAAFAALTNESGHIRSYRLGSEITSISVNRSTDGIAGARIYFFVADKTLTNQYSADGFPPAFSYAGYGSNVVQCANPPQTDYPIYNYIELTSLTTDSSAVIDVSAVDGFNFPISISLNDGLGRPLGQPLDFSSSNFNRQIILDGFAPFMTNLAAEGGLVYTNLQYASNGGGLLNPTFYLDQTQADAGYAEAWVSPLNHAFDAALNAFFSATNAAKLSILSDSAGTNVSEAYTATYTTNLTYPGSGMKHPALVFTGATSGRTLAVFNPVNFSVSSCQGASNMLQLLHGQMSNTTLHFTVPLPAGTPIIPQMYVDGPGANNASQVVAVHTNAGGAITSLTLNNGIGIAGAGHFRFAKAAGMFQSAGTMVFACNGLFDSEQGLTGDEATILKALKRDIVTAFNRGTANLSPATGAAGRTSAYWGTQTNWYPAGEAQNLFSLYMHTGTVKVGAEDVPVFTRPDHAVKCARGTTMGMSYGFAYDENDGHGPAGQPQVPAKYDPLPVAVTTTTVTLGPWQANDDPVPAVFVCANGQGDLLTVYHPAPVSVTVTAHAGQHAGTPVDWFVVAAPDTGDWHYRSLSGEWLPFPANDLAACRPALQQGLVTIPSSVTVLDNYSLPQGGYWFYVVVDHPMDGVLNLLPNQHVYDAVRVVVQ